MTTNITDIKTTSRRRTIITEEDKEAQRQRRNQYQREYLKKKMQDPEFAANYNQKRKKHDIKYRQANQENIKAKLRELYLNKKNRLKELEAMFASQ